MRFISTISLHQQKRYIILTFGFIFSFFTSIILNAQVSGTVFRDFDANGQKTATNPIEPGVGGVTVKAFKADGTQAGPTATTLANGTYSIATGTAAQVRIEFSNLPSAYFTGPAGSGSGTSVQFVSGSGGVANLGINYPADYAGIANPKLVTPCYENGTPLNGGTSANDPFIVTVPYTPTGDGTAISENNYIAKGSEVGATWGIAYQRSSKFVFASALLKRHSGFGSGGLGAIYKIDVSNVTPVASLFVDLNTDLGIAVGTDPRTATGVNSVSLDKTAPNHDAGAFGLVGKMSLGDIDISDDEQTLWVINTFDKKLYELPIGSPAVKPTTKIAHTLPNPGCTNGIFRPWATKFWRGKIYVGGVCTAENAGGTAADLKAYIYSFTPGDANPDNFTEVYHFNLNYPRGYTSISSTVDKTSAAWKPWIAQWSDITNPAPGAATYSQTICPQPIFSDIEFDVDGSMIVGFMDRAGHQLGNSNYSPILADVTTYEGTSAGDLLRIGFSNGVYTLENNATVNGVVSGGNGQSPSQGPGTGEFYWQDMYVKNANKNYPDGTASGGGGHQEISLGGLALLPGKNEVVETVFDPVTVFRTAGLKWFDNTTGAAPRAYQIFGQDAGGGSTTFGKANGLGDVELLLKPAPIELGNRVWKDLNNDGIQDPNEPVLVGVTAGLYTAGGTFITSAITDANGNYIFSSATGTSTPNIIYGLNITPNTGYEIRVTALGSDPSVSGLALTAIPPAPGETGSTNTGTTLANNDAKLVSGIPTIILQTGDFGENNHTYDIALATCAAPTSITIGSNSPVCVGKSIDLTASAVGGLGTMAYAWAGPNAYVSSTQNPSIAPATVAMTGTYTVTVSSGTGCSATNTIAVSVNPTPTAAATGATVCTGGTISLSASGGTGYAWTGPASFSSTTQNPSIASASAANVGTYTVLVTNGNGCTASTVVNVAVNSSITAGATGATACVGASINLSASGGTSYAWTGPASFTSTTQNPSIVSAIIANEGVYSVTVTNAGGCTATTTANVVVNASPTASATGATACVGGTLNLSASGGTFYVWNGPNAFNSSSQNPSIPSAILANGGVYTVSVSDGSGCPATATANVVVNPNPTAVATGMTVCVGGNINLQASGGGSYAWIGPNSFSSTLQNPSIASAVANNAGVYSVIITNANGCTATATADVVVNPNATASATGATVCVGASISLQAAGGTDYVWTGPNAFSSNVQNPTITTITAADAGVYSITVTNGNGCTATTTAMVVVNPSPTATATGATVCAGVSINLTASGGGSYDWTGPNNFSSASQNPSIANSTTAMAGVYTVTVSSTAGCTATTTVNVLVNPNPIATATGATACAGGNIQLNASGGISYAWTGPNTFSSTLQSPSINSISASNAGTYSVTVTNANGCTATTTANVSVSAVATAAATGATACIGSTINLAASGGSTYAWTGPNGYNSTIQNPSIANATAAMAGVYTVTVSSGSSCTATTTANVVVNPAMSATATGATVCAGNAINMNAAGGTSYVWTGPNTFNSTLQNPSIANSTVAMGGVYSVVVTNAVGCTATATANVVVNPNPTAGATGSTVCTGQSVTLFASGGTSYSWSGPSAFNSTNQNPTILNATAINAGIYTVTVTNGACSAIATTNVLVNSSITAAATGATVCVGTSINLSASGGNSYTWIGPNAFNSATQNPTIANATTAMAGVYTVTVSSGAGCTATTTANVVVNPNPTAGATGATICAGATLNLLSSGGTSYAWTGPSSFTATLQNPSIPNAPTALTGVYTVIVTNATGCTATATANVLVNPNPTASATGATACVGGTVSLKVSGGISYAWTGPNAFSSTVQSPNISNLSASNAGTYSVTVTNANGCTATTTANVSVSASATASATGATVCVGTSINLTASGGSTYAWTGPNTFSSTTQSPIIANATAAMAGVYTVTVSSGSSCTATATANVVVNPSGTASATGATICTGGTINMISTIGTSYAWTGPSAFSATIQNPSIANATAAMGGIYTVTVSTGASCTATATANVVVNPRPTISTISTNSPVTQGNPINLSVSSTGTTYAWVGPNSFTSTVQNPTINGATAAMAGVYTVTVSSTAGCTATATTLVAVTPSTSTCAVPTITSVVSNSPVNTGGTITCTLNSTGGISYAWAGPNSFTSTVQNPSIANAIVGMAGVYTVTVTSSGTCLATATTSVTVTPSSTCALSVSTNVICKDQGTVNPADDKYDLSITVNGTNTPFGSFWQSTDAAVATGAYGVSKTIANYGLISAGPVTFTISDNTDNACSMPVTITPPLACSPTCNLAMVVNSVTCDDKGTPSTADDEMVISVTMSGSDGKTWSLIQKADENNIGVPIDLGDWTGDQTVTLNINIQNAVAGYTGQTGFVLQYALNGYTDCVGAQFITKPICATICTTPLITAIASNSPVTVGGTINLAITTFNASTFAWTGPNGFTSTTQNPNIAAATTAMAGVYTITVTSSVTCTATATVKVQINPVLATCTKPNAGPDIEFCEPGASIDLPDAATGQNWEVGPNNPANASIIPSAGAVAGMTVNGTYMFILQGGNNCADTVLIFRRPKPNAGVDITVCSPISSVTLSKSGIWSAVSGNPTTATITSVGLVTGMTVDGTYKFMLLSASGCSDTVAVIRKPKPNAGADLTGANAVCSNTNTTTLTGTPAGGTWSAATGNAATASVSSTGVVTGLTANGNYTFIYTSNGCADSVLVERKDCITPTCVKPNAGADVAICATTSTVNLVDATAGQTWSSQVGNPSTVAINATTGVVTGLTRNGIFNFILTATGTGSNCTDTVKVTRGIIEYPYQTVCSPAVTFQLPAAGQGNTWAAVAGNPATATVNNSGSVNGIVADGIYKFTISNGTCTDTVTIERKVCVPQYDLALSKRISKQKPALNDVITYTIIVKNEGNLPATGVEVKDTLNAGVVFQSFNLVHGTGTYNYVTGLWNIGAIAIGDSAVMVISVKVVQPGVWFNTAEITKMNEKDVDSTPNNGTTTEDDIDRICFSTPVTICSSQKIVLTSPAGLTNVEWFNGATSLGKSATYTITASGSYSFIGSDGASCTATSCCALDVVVEDCCKADICTPFVVEKKKK